MEQALGVRVPALAGDWVLAAPMGWRRGFGRGGGGGRGFGRFWGYGPYQPQVTKKEEKEILEDEVTGLEEELKAIKARLTELKGQKN